MAKDDPKGDLELNEFLNELISLIRGRLDEQQNLINNLEKRIDALEKMDIKSMIDKGFKSYDGVTSDLRERLTSLEESNGLVEDIKKKVTTLEVKAEKLRTVSKNLLESLKG